MKWAPRILDLADVFRGKTLSAQVWRADASVSPRTKRNYRSALAKFDEAVAGKPVADSVIADYLADLHAAGKSPGDVQPGRYCSQVPRPAAGHPVARDLDNLALALPNVNRSKSGKDAAEWLPKRSRCWFARTIIRVKAKYGLSVDAREKAALTRHYRRVAFPEMEGNEDYDDNSR